MNFVRITMGCRVYGETSTRIHRKSLCGLVNVNSLSCAIQPRHQRPNAAIEREESTTNKTARRGSGPLDAQLCFPLETFCVRSQYDANLCTDLTTPRILVYQEEPVQRLSIDLSKVILP